MKKKGHENETHNSQMRRLSGVGGTLDLQIICRTRNKRLLEKFQDSVKCWREWVERRQQFIAITLEAKTILKVARVYIRLSGAEYNSLSFNIQNGPYKGCRFWAKLND